MNQDLATTISADAILLCGKSWTAYAGTVVMGAILLLCVVPMAFLWHPWAGAGALLLSLPILAYRVMVTRSYRLYYDDVGVWLFAGALPWEKGRVGVKWRDMDEATFVTNFRSWASNSYSIRVGHRFSKESEIAIDDMAGGKDAVILINNRLQALIRERSIV